MPIPDDIRAEAEAHLDRYCVGLIPKHAQDNISIGHVVKGMAITPCEQSILRCRHTAITIRHSLKMLFDTAYSNYRRCSLHAAPQCLSILSPFFVSAALYMCARLGY